MLAFNNNKQQDRLASSIDALDYCCLLAIARLLRLCLATLLRAYNNHYGWDNTYLKLSLVEVIDICLLDTIPRNYIPYKRKLTTNNL